MSVLFGRRGAWLSFVFEIYSLFGKKSVGPCHLLGEVSTFPGIEEGTLILTSQ